MGYSPRGRKESDTTERLHFHFHFHFQVPSVASKGAIVSDVKDVFLVLKPVRHLKTKAFPR